MVVMSTHDVDYACVNSYNVRGEEYEEKSNFSC